MSHKNSNRNFNRKPNPFGKNVAPNRSIYDSLEKFTDDAQNIYPGENKKKNDRERRAIERRQKFEQEKLEQERLEQERLVQERLEQERLAIKREQKSKLPKLPLETPWDFGYMKSSRSSNWEEILCVTVNDVHDFWQLANSTFAAKDFRMSSNNYNEFWLFRSGCLPTWEKAKKWANIDIFYQVNLANIYESHVLDAVLYCIGETIVCSDHVLGIRFKPSTRYPPTIKIWVSNEESAIQIEKFLMKNLTARGAINLESEIEEK